MTIVNTTRGDGDGDLAHVKVGECFPLFIAAEKHALDGPEDVAGREDHRGKRPGPPERGYS